MDALVSRKICPRCGMIFNVSDDPVYCSDKCKKLFQVSSLDFIKGRAPSYAKQTESLHQMPQKPKPSYTVSLDSLPSIDDANTEIMKPGKKKV